MRERRGRWEREEENGVRDRDGKRSETREEDDEERRDTCRERGKRELLYNWRLYTPDSLIAGASPVITAACTRVDPLLRIGVLIISLPI